MQEAGATRYLRKNGWMKLYRSEDAFTVLRREFDLAQEFGLPLEQLDAAGAQALEPSLNPVFSRAVFWPKAASLSNPLAVTRAYAARFSALGGVTLNGDARSLHRAGNNWRVETNEGALDSRGSGRRARPLGARRFGAARDQAADGDQTRLSPPFPRRGQCGAVAAGGRCRLRLSDHADGAGHPAHHRRRIRRARRKADARAVRPLDAAGAPLFASASVPTTDLDGQPAVLSRFHAPSSAARRGRAACGLPSGTRIGG